MDIFLTSIAVVACLGKAYPQTVQVTHEVVWVGEQEGGGRAVLHTGPGSTDLVMLEPNCWQQKRQLLSVPHKRTAGQATLKANMSACWAQ
jgi:hypothetical protein